MLMIPIPIALFAAELLVADPKLCAAADRATALAVQEAPLAVLFHADSNCLVAGSKADTVRVWKYPHQYQRLASAEKKWKVVLEDGKGDRRNFPLPLNSIVGVYLHQLDPAKKWKAYRGTSKNPMAVTQPVILFTLRKVSEATAGGLKTEHLVWDVMTMDALGLDTAKKDGAAAYPAPAGASDLRVDEVWIWQGMNPIPKKVNFGSGKGKVSVEAE